MNIHDIIEIQGRMFQVKRKFPENRINLEVKDSTKILKDLYHCDTTVILMQLNFFVLHLVLVLVFF